MTDATRLFAQWENFYVIVGSSGAALTGLQFVVMALVADAQRKGSAETVSAFGTPTIVHFCVVLATAAILSAPWHSTSGPQAILATIGVGGIIYATVVTVHAGRQRSYRPVLEDWIWHSILPLVAYVLLFLGALGIERVDGAGLFTIGGVALLLLLIGIHNAWDSVAYVATQQYGSAEHPKDTPPT